MNISNEPLEQPSYLAGLEGRLLFDVPPYTGRRGFQFPDALHGIFERSQQTGKIQNTTDMNLLLFKRPIAAFGPLFSWLSIGPAIVKALNGDASDFATHVAGPPNDPAYGIRAIECLDFPVQARNFGEFTGRTTFARIVAPHLGGATETGRIISTCLGWPRPRANPRHFLDVKGAPPSLIVNATHDPSTSYVWALSMQAQIPGSVLLTRDGDGHTSYLTSPCAQEAIDRYLIELVLPLPGTVCLD